MKNVGDYGNTDSVMTHSTRHHRSLFGLLAAIVLICAACDDKRGHEPASVATSVESEEAPSASADAVESELGDAIVVASGPLTELVFALGHGERVAAVDTSSIYPAAAAKRPKIGFFRKLAAEPILATEPTSVLVSESAGPDATLEQLETSGVPVHRFDEPDSFEKAPDAIRKLASLLGTPEAAAPLVESLEADLAKVDDAANRTEGTRALFIYARGPNVLMVAGKNTAADTMLRRAGVTNAAADLEGFKPMTPESVIAARPDVLVMTEKGAKSVGGWEGVSALPGVSETPAAEHERIATVDDLAFLSFGPRSGASLLDFQSQLRELLDDA